MQPVILVLLALNIGLGAWFGLAMLNRGRTPAARITPTNSPAKTVAAPRTAQVFDPKMLTTWPDVNSADLRLYVRNLRAIKCPEETIRDIILAEVNRRFAPREKALKIHADQYQPWETPTTEGVAHYERRQQIRALFTEKRKLLKDLLGVDVPLENPIDLANGNMDRFEAAYATLQEEQKRDAVRAIDEDYWHKIDELKKKSLGVLDASDREELKRLKTERRDALAKVLTPPELFEYDLKSSATSAMLTKQMNGFEATDAEFRQMFKLAQQYDPELMMGRGIIDPNDPAANEKRKQAERDLQKLVADSLGQERFAEMQKFRDTEYQNLNKVAKEFSLPPASVQQAYEIQKTSTAALQQLLKDNTMAPDQKQAAIQAVQQQTSTTLQGLLGQAGYNKFNQINGANKAATAIRNQLAPRSVPTGIQLDDTKLNFKP